MISRRGFLKYSPVLPFILNPVRGMAADALDTLVNTITLGKYYKHPFSEENSRKVKIKEEEGKQRLDISQIDMATLSTLEKGGYNYNLPSVKFEDIIYRVVTGDGVKVYGFDSNGISDPISNDVLEGKLVKGYIGYSADLMNANGEFPFHAVKGKLVINEEKLDGKKEFHIIARS